MKPQDTADSQPTMTPKAERERAARLTQVYPQPAGDRMTFTHNPVPLPVMPTSNDKLAKLSWVSVLVYGWVLPLPFVLSDIGMTFILNSNPVDAAARPTALLVSIPLLLSTGAMFYIVRRLALSELTSFLVHTRRILLWFTLFIVPIVVAIRYVFTLTDLSLGHQMIGYAVVSGIATAAALGLYVYLCEVTRKDAATRSLFGLALTIVPYAVGIIVAGFAFIR